jgi:hypothetical protein
MANGIPSRRWQLSTPRGNAAGAFDKQGHRREVDARTHLQRGHQPQLLVGDPQSFAAGRKTLTVAECARIASTRSAAASGMCSQLSKTNSRTLPSNAAATLSFRLFPGCWVRPSTAGSATAANSKTQAPSGNSSARRAATSVARPALPTPPTPVNVTNR